ncbi:MAG TPA: FHA domain-containing protein, partial [Polyangiaceae bacterium]|nr:FHA domain-containing protein [Polyangiaceae bacterium]
MVQPPAGNDAIDEAEGEPTPGAPHGPEGAAARQLPEPVALCWLFPVSTLPPHLLTRRSVIGRADDCDVSLVGRAVSRHHAEIERGATATLLKDLRSTNGVYLNGVSVTESPVVPGDVLRVGNWVGFLTARTDGHPGPLRALGP